MRYSHDHIHLTTQSVDDWVQWYVDSMGAVVVRTNMTPDGPMVFLDVGGASVRISSSTGVEKYFRDQTGELVLPPEGYHHFGFTVDDIDACMADLVSRGAEIEAGIRQPSGAVRSSFLKLPGGVKVR